MGCDLIGDWLKTDLLQSNLRLVFHARLPGFISLLQNPTQDASHTQIVLIINMCIYIYTVQIPRTQMIHILEDLTHKIEGQPPSPPKKGVIWVPGHWKHY